MILEESQLLFSTMRGLNAASLTTLKGNYIIKYSMWSGIVPFRAARVWPYICHFDFYRGSGSVQLTGIFPTNPDPVLPF